MGSDDRRTETPPEVVHLIAVPEWSPDPHLDLVAGALAERHAVEVVQVSLVSTADGLDGEARRTFELFDHTPQPLLDAWLLARGVAQRTPDGATVLVSDRSGVGGMLALIESQRPDDVRRHVWSVAGSGRHLRESIAFGTTDHLEMPAVSEVDWELVQYRNAARVLVTCELARQRLELVGVVAEIALEPTTRIPPPLRAPASRVYAAGRVSRRNRSGEVMRAIADRATTRLTVSDRDALDAVWEGTTWDANRGIRSILGERLTRDAEPPPDLDLVVVGDPLAPPDRLLSALRESDVPIAAPAGGVIASLWTDVRPWRTSDDLSAIVGGREPGQDITDVHGAPDSSSHSMRVVADRSRARRVSVGIPAFGRPVYLDECVASILDQTEPVAEILIIDDGSRSEELDRSLDRWGQADERVRVLRQPNRGVCVARNAMLDAMSGDAFLLVDQDDILRPDFVAATASALRADTGLAAVATWTEFFGDYSAIEAKPPFDARVAHRENPIVSTAVLVDMAVRDGGIRFEPDLAFLYCEDWNFWSQIVASGRRMGLVPAPLVRHRVHRASGGFQRTELAHRIGKARALAPFERSD